MVNYDQLPALNAYLEEYKSLRNEQLARLGSQNQSINFLFIILGATVGFIATLWKDIEHINLISGMLPILGLFIPILTAPLGFIFFDNEMAIFSIGSRIYDIIGRVRVLLKDDNILENAFLFKYLPPSSKSTHKLISMARWILFIIPTFLSTIIIFIYGLSNTNQICSNFYQAVGFLVIFSIDVILNLLLLKAIIWSWKVLKLLHENRSENFQQTKITLTNY